MGEIVDLERIRKEARLREIQEALPEINLPFMQTVIRLREETELDHSMAGALGVRTVKSAFLDGMEVEYTLENRTLDSIRKIIALRVKGYKLDDIPEKELAPYLMTLMEVFITEGGRPPKVFTAAPEGITDVIGYVQDVVPIVLREMNPNLITKFGGCDFGTH